MRRGFKMLALAGAVELAELGWELVLVAVSYERC
jgi:hypothetical protein